MPHYLSSFFCVFWSDCSVAWCLCFEALLKGSRSDGRCVCRGRDGRLCDYQVRPRAQNVWASWSLRVVAAAITYDLMTPAAIGRHSGGSRDCSCCPFSARPPAGVNTASCSRLVCVPAKCQRAGTGLSSVSLLSALSGWPPPTRLCDLLITPRYVSQRQHGV